MTIQSPVLYPLKAGEILDRAFRLYCAHFWFFIRLTGVLLVPMLILEFLSQYFFQSTQILDLIESFLTTYLLNGALTWATSQFYLGNTVLINNAYRQAQRHFKPLFGANVRQVLAYIPLAAVLLWLADNMRGSSLANQLFPLICVGVFLGPFFVLLVTRWGVTIPVIMLENTTGGDGLGRSWSLTDNNFKHTFAIMFASSLLSYLIVSLPSLLVNYTIEYLSISIDRAYVLSLSMLLKQFGQIITLPLALSIPVILYYDLCVRREGFDLALMLEATETKEDMPGEELTA